ncbi:hypothetical protein PG995_002425 [Apiospora arundinis]|uniref:RNA-binding domain-containing protein n=1 Tax=Apiospora arundinis TaxID=335852 RepID=A0ABR2J5D1_9PEZI
MAAQYAAGRPGSKTDEDIVTSRADDSSTKNPSRGNTNTPIPDDDEAPTGSSAEQESTPPSTGTTYNTPVLSGSADPSDSPKVKTAITPAMTSAVQGGHKSRLSGSTVVSSSGHENTAKDEQSHENGSVAGGLFSTPSSNHRELDPATPAFVPKVKVKHHCSTEAAIDERRRIYIGNLKFTLERDDIAGLLETYGVYKPECCCIYVPPPSHRKNPKTTPEHRNRGYCFATFTDSGSAITAMEKLDHIIFADRKLVCRCCLPKGLSYSKFLERTDYIEQGRVLDEMPHSRQESGVQEQDDVPPFDHFSSHGPSPQKAFCGGSSPSRRPRPHRQQHYYQPYYSPRVGAPGQPRQERPRRPGLPRSPRRHYQQKKFDPLLEQNMYPHYYYPYHHYDESPQSFPDQQQVVMPEPWLMPEYYPVTYWHQPPASGHHAVLLDSFKRHTAVEDPAVEECVAEEPAVATNTASENSSAEGDNEDVYIPPKKWSQADGRTIELLNLEPGSGRYRDFKAFIEGLLAGKECDVTGVSVAIPQYDPHRTRLVQNVGGSAYISCPLAPGSNPETTHICPLVYCYVQLATKEQAERAFKELNGKQIRHGGEVRQYRVNMEWNLPLSD